MDLYSIISVNHTQLDFLASNTQKHHNSYKVTSHNLEMHLFHGFNDIVRGTYVAHNKPNKALQITIWQNDIKTIELSYRLHS